MANTQGMFETGMGSSWVDKVASSNLLEKTQPLELLGINDCNSNSRKLDMAMNTEYITRLYSDHLQKFPKITTFYFLALGIPVIDDFFRDNFSQIDVVLCDGVT
jgi:hypothetical protein